ncbi:hypothetical protein SOV_35630 [Sporomusa ovata DSM 2662]|uniref:hypothetical protein n=2 Tax=Sporomusa ovata TaxID=2378 RepID=UPI00038842A7|nr:hypothetical protein [Sporomusa ovata]EQB24609.1 hypothetical protein SOV_6c00230 [Sporomusa ovata DSM 2662]EQB24713.1 hypothetical protein SOV_6c01270 [Sporomusa ovata DSM 2662]
MATQLDTIRRKYRDWEMEYAVATKEQQTVFREAWTANGIQFEITESGMVAFSKQVAAEQVAIETEKNQKLKDLHYERVKFQEDLDQARAEGDIARFQELLTSEQALLAQELTGKQEYIDSYYKIWQDAHRISMSYMAQYTNGMYDGLKGVFSDVITGTKSIGDAWSDLGTKIIKIIADIAAEWLASRIVMSVFGSSFLKGGLAGSANPATGSSKPKITLPKFALGGNYDGGLALVGERGPELINFNRGGRVYNAQDTQSMMSAGSPTIVMNINALYPRCVLRQPAFADNCNEHKHP